MKIRATGYALKSRAQGNQAPWGTIHPVALCFTVCVDLLPPAG